MSKAERSQRYWVNLVASECFSMLIVTTVTHYSPHPSVFGAWQGYLSGSWDVARHSYRSDPISFLFKIVTYTLTSLTNFQMLIPYVGSFFFVMQLHIFLPISKAEICSPVFQYLDIQILVGNQTVSVSLCSIYTLTIKELSPTPGHHICLRKRHSSSVYPNLVFPKTVEGTLWLSSWANCHHQYSPKSNRFPCRDNSPK